MARRPQTEQVLELISNWLFYIVFTLSIPLGLMYGLGAAENTSNLVKFFLYAIIGLPVVIFSLIRNGMDPGAAVVASNTVSVVTTTLAFLFYHNFRYGAAETSQVGILLLGFITNTLTAVTHSIILAYMIHGSGNLFEKASSAGIWANEVAVAVALIAALVGIVVFGFIFILDSQ